MPLTASGRQDTATVVLDLDMRAWLRERAERQSIRSISAVIRQLIREKMDAEQQPAETRRAS